MNEQELQAIIDRNLNKRPDGIHQINASVKGDRVVPTALALDKLRRKFYNLSKSEIVCQALEEMADRIKD